jgi:hypothetical protein
MSKSRLIAKHVDHCPERLRLEDIPEMSTPALLGWLRSYFTWPDETVTSTLNEDMKAAVRAELAKRPNLPSKQQARKIRQQIMKEKQNR